MTNDIVKLEVNPKDFGIEEKQANDLLGHLPLILEERMPLIADFQTVTSMDINDPQAAKLARVARLAIRDNRTKGIEVWRKSKKEWFLRGGQFIDATAKIRIEENLYMEEQLEAIEKHAENQERIRLDALEQERLEKLEPFKDFVPFGANIRNISDEDFEKLLNGSKLQFDAKVAADKAAEEARIAAEKKAEADRREAQRIENEARIEREKQAEAQRIENAKLKAEAEAREAAIELERKAAREAAAKIEAQRQAELQVERDKQAKLAAELAAKLKAEAEAKQAREAAELAAKKEADKLAKAPIKKQIAAWIESMELPHIDLDNELVKQIKARFEDYKNWCAKLNE